MNTQQFTISPIPDDIFAKMQGKSFKDNCTVPREDLRYLKVMHVGFDGKTHTGGAGVGSAAHVLPLLRRCAVGGGHLSGKGRCTGHHLPGVPVSRAGKAGEKEKRKKEESVRRTEAQKGSPAPPEGEADPADPLHHLKRGGKAYPGHHRLPALHPNRCCPRCPGRRPCRGCPQLWQAERLALPDPGLSGPVPLSGLRAAPAPAGFRQRRAHRKGSHLLPGHGPGLCHRFHASARSVRVLARKGTGRFYLARV